MNIGSVKPQDGGELLGHLAIMSFDARVGLKPVASTSDRAPKFEIVALNVARRWVRIRALWEKEARETGEVYLADHIDDPALPSKLFVAAFRQADDAYAIAWTRTNPQTRSIDGAAGDVPPIGEGDGEAADQEHPDAPLSEAAPARSGSRPRRRAEPALEDDDPFA